MPTGVGRCCARKTFASRPAPHRELCADVAVGGFPDDESCTGHDSHQLMELALDCRNVWKDIGVIVFDVIDEERASMQVHELRALVEEGGVVLIGFDDKKGA